MKTIDDSGPAFPFNHQNPEGNWINPGMTLRDWFAGQVLATDWIGDYSAFEAAEVAYKFADAMLLQRNKEASK